VGSVIASSLDWAGWDVTREFYINDAGNQVLNFGRSLEARYRQALGEDVPVPQEGYHGEDLLDLMRELVSRDGDKYLQLSEAERLAFLTQYGLSVKLDDIRRDLAAFGVDFDIWFSEQHLHDDGEIAKAVEHLKQGGHAYEEGGAIWLRSTAFGDDKDRVIIRNNGLPTYVAADLAYHRDKYSRGYDRVIDVWGADHHGYIQRMKAGISALGWDPDTFDVVLYQLVNLIQDGQPVVMSKRSGKLVTLRDVVEEVGRDTARFFYIMRSADTQLDFDLDLAKSESDDNPIYYVQYAHARICSIISQAVEARMLPGSFSYETTVLGLA
jgi:arginyl-tRNA synthetase